MERWNLLLGAHDYVWRDQALTLEVRIQTCKMLRSKMLQIGPLLRGVDDIRLGELLEIMRHAK